MTKPALKTFSTFAPVFVQTYERYLPTAFDESMTLLEKVNKIIQYMNIVTDSVNSVIPQWNEVMDWVMNDGLSEMIIQRLDQMVEDGTLAELINEELLGNLKDATFNSAYYHNIKVEELFDSVTQTTYHLVTIPFYDEKGNKILWKRGFAHDTVNGGTTETAREFATRHNATVTINASMFNTTTFKLQGMQIVDGVVVNYEENQRIDRQILGLKDDGSFTYYPANTPSQTILADGVKNALSGFMPLISNGQPIPDSILNTYDAATWKYRRQVLGQMANGDYVILSTQSDTYGDKGFDLWDCIRVLSARGVKFAFMLDGGGSMQTVVRGLNIVPPKDVAGTQDRPVPDFLYIAKPLVTDRDKDIRDVNGDVGYLKTIIEKNRSDIYTKTDMLNGYIRLKTGNPDYASHGIEIWAGDVKQAKLYITKDFLSYYDYLHDPNNGGTTVFKVTTDGQVTVMGNDISGNYANLPSDLNTIVKSGDYWVTPSVSGNPDGASSWYVKHVELDTSGQFALQMAQSFRTPSTRMVRRKNNGVWEAWG